MIRVVVNDGDADKKPGKSHSKNTFFSLYDENSCTSENETC